MKSIKKDLSDGYQLLTKNIKSNISSPNIIIDKGTANMHPTWSPDGTNIAFISNADNDFFSQTDLFIYDKTKTKQRIFKKMLFLHHLGIQMGLLSTIQKEQNIQISMVQNILIYMNTILMRKKKID